MENKSLTTHQRRALVGIATTGITPTGISERTIMSLARRLLLGSCENHVAVTRAGCDAIGMQPSRAIRVGEPFPYWTNR